MVAYNFKSQFVEPILAESKQHTIRAHRKGRGRHARVGEELQLYVGMRTPRCYLIARATCVGVKPVTIQFPLTIPPPPEWPEWGSVEVRSEMDLPMYHLERREELDEFAISDGFESWPAMMRFWEAEHPEKFGGTFEGVMIEWEKVS